MEMLAFIENYYLSRTNTTAWKLEKKTEAKMKVGNNVGRKVIKIIVIIVKV